MTFTWHQVAQSLWQFAVTLTGLLVVMDGPPQTVEEWWKPVLASLAAALAIWAGSKAKLPDAAE